MNNLIKNRKVDDDAYHRLFDFFIYILTMLKTVLKTVDNVSMDFKRLLLHLSKSIFYMDYEIESKLVINNLLIGFQVGFQHFTVVYMLKSF